MGILKKLNKLKVRIRNKTQVDDSKTKITLADLFSNQLNSLEDDETLQICLKFRCESLGKMPIKLVQRTNDTTTELKDNPLYNILFSRPNKNQDASNFIYMTEEDRLLKGTSYVKINRYPNGKVASLVRLRPDLVVPPVIINDLDINKNLVYRYNGILIDSEDLLVFKNGFNKTNPIVGKSCINSLKTILRSNIDGAKSIANMNNNGINAAVKVSIEDTIDSDRAEEIVINALKSAKGYASKGVILEENGVKISPFEVDLKATQYLETYKANKCSIISYFGLNASMLNIEQATGTYSNSDSQNLAFLTNTLLFVMEEYINELNYKLLTPQQIKKGITFEFDTENILKVDYKTLVSTTSELIKNSVVTINEARSKLNYANRADGDRIIVNGAYVDLDNLGIAYQNNIKGGENDEKEN